MENNNKKEENTKNQPGEQNEEKTLTLHAYDWTVEDRFPSDDGDSDHVAIHAWCLDRESKPHLLRFNDFPSFVHIELPMFINGRYFRWTQEAADRFVNWLSRYLDDDKPDRALLKWAKKIYYYRGGKMYPFLLLTFPTIAAMYRCENFLNKPHKIDDFGLVACRVWESSVSIIRKLLTLRNCRYSQWFRVDATLVPKENKVSTIENEYRVKWRSLIPVPNAESKGWVTQPRVLSFDIECYSNNHKAMPSQYSSLHVVNAISLVYQQVGHPETRKRYSLVLGDCDEITLPETRQGLKPGTKTREIITEKTPGDLKVEVIRCSTEIELINTMSRLVRELDPEILMGYNILSFDYPYLDARLKGE